MNFLKKSADNTRPDSVSNKFRRNRFRFFLEFINELPRPVRILDLGGTYNFWEQMGYSNNTEFNITILNSEIPAGNPDSIKFIKGDARDLALFENKEFDVVFSNSVIEHVGSYNDQKKMADEVMRTGKKYFIQTPNYFFPFEPHFLFPFFQFLPRKLQIFLLIHFNLGWFTRCSSPVEAQYILDSINLLTLNDLTKFFPACSIYREKFLFLNKSFIAYSSNYCKTYV